MQIPVNMIQRMIPLMLVALLHGQDKPARLTFEVASIKPFKPSGGRGGEGSSRSPRARVMTQ
jgi:hypothetical protein